MKQEIKNESNKYSSEPQQLMSSKELGSSNHLLWSNEWNSHFETLSIHSVPQLLNGNTHTGLRVNRHMLLIENAMLSHEGQYTCVVTNSAGEDKRDFHLIIQGQCKLYKH